MPLPFAITQQVLFAVAIEFALIMTTVLLLTQPRLLFRGNSQQLRSLATGSGMFLLCVTFCWSVILGCVLALNNIVINL